MALWTNWKSLFAIDKHASFGRHVVADVTLPHCRAELGVVEFNQQLVQRDVDDNSVKMIGKWAKKSAKADQSDYKSINRRRSWTIGRVECLAW
jgi:hypothetical protein